MTYHDKESILAEARENVRLGRQERADREAGRSPFRYAEQRSQLVYSEHENKLERWKREANELEMQRAEQRAVMSFEVRISERVNHIERTLLEELKADLRHELVHAMRGVNSFARTVQDRLDQISDEIEKLNAKIAGAEARLDLRVAANEAQHQGLRRADETRLDDVRRAVEGKIDRDDVGDIASAIKVEFDRLKEDISRIKSSMGN